MGLYQLLTTGVNASQLITNLEQRHEAIRSNERGTSQPTVLVTGLLWERTDEPTIGNAIKRYNGSSFALLMDPDFAQINAGGTVAFTADQPMGTRKLTGLAAGSSAGDSVRYEQVLLLAGGTMAGTLNMNNNRITNLPGPQAGEDAARKFYVDLRAATQGAGTWDPSLGVFNVTLGAGVVPRAVAVQIEQMNPTVAAPHTTPPSTMALFVAGTGSESGRVIHGGTTSPHTTPTFEGLTLTWLANGFNLQVASTSWRYVRARYLLWQGLA